MRKWIFLVSSFLIFTSTVSSALDRHCGTAEPAQVQKLIFNNKMMMTDNSVPQFKVLDTVVHVISRRPPELEIIEEQMQVLNDAYFDSGYRFELLKINIVEDEEITRLFSGGELSGGGEINPDYEEGKRFLHEGEEDTLNIYITDLRSLLGWATFPWDYKTDPLSDGVVVATSSLPGVDGGHYNEGQTLTHEVGHWMGLYHTFQGSCSEEGDLIDDTPAHRSPTSSCSDFGRISSCPGVNQSIPMKNYMNYSYDACMTEFSIGQAERMDAAYAAFRLPFVVIEGI